MAENTRAQYRYRPPRTVVTIADKIQTARKEFGVRGGEEDIEGTNKARNVDRCTTKNIIGVILDWK
jgi:hypothetical protein